MSGGAYSALSGMRSRLEELDRIASDLANVSTAGYKTERAGTLTVERDGFGSMLESAVDVVVGQKKVDFTPGVMATTGNSLDVAIDGRGFFAIETPAGVRYTRNGSFSRRADGTLTTAQGDAVLGDAGAPIKLPAGAVRIEADGTIISSNGLAGQLQMVNFAEGDLVRESGARFRAIPGAEPEDFDGSLIGGALEQSNVQMVDRMVALTEVSRGFDMLQRGVSTLMNDIDSKAISELGRR
jgi:flagellar basal-body rod protein FlgF